MATFSAASDDLGTGYLSTSKTALSLAILNRSAEAEEILDEVRFSCTDPQMHMSAAYSTGMLYTRHYEDDKADVTAGLARQPGNPHLLVTLGQIHAENGESAAAREAFDRALDIEPDLVTALSNRAALAYDLGEFDLAVEDLRHAVELRPDDAALRYNRAFAYQGKDRWADAVADLDVAARLEPDDEDIREARQSCLDQLSRQAAAV